MKRSLPALATVLALAGCAPPLPAAAPSAAGTLLTPVPAAAVAEGAVAPPMPLPTGVFRLHIDSPAPVPLTEALGFGGVEYGVASIRSRLITRTVCVSPCDALIDARSGHEYALDATTFPAAGPFRFPAGGGGDLTLFVKPGNNALLTTGRWATALGAAPFAVSVVLVPVLYQSGPVPFTGINAAAVVMLVGSTVALAVGIPLLVTQETKIRFTPVALSRITAGAISF